MPRKLSRTTAFRCRVASSCRSAPCWANSPARRMLRGSSAVVRTRTSAAGQCTAAVTAGTASMDSGAERRRGAACAWWSATSSARSTIAHAASAGPVSLVRPAAGSRAPVNRRRRSVATARAPRSASAPAAQPAPTASALATAKTARPRVSCVTALSNTPWASHARAPQRVIVTIVSSAWRVPARPNQRRPGAAHAVSHALSSRRCAALPGPLVSFLASRAFLSFALFALFALFVVMGAPLVDDPGEATGQRDGDHAQGGQQL